MRTLVAFSLLVAAVVADPQLFYSSSILPTHHVLGHSGLVSTPLVTPYVASVTYPSQDTSRGLPTPVQDTFEVKHAKAVFAENFKNEALRTSLYHGIHKRDVGFMNLGIKTPASTVPMVYSTLGSVAVPTHVSHWNTGIVPYIHSLHKRELLYGMGMGLKTPAATTRMVYPTYSGVAVPHSHGVNHYGVGMTHMTMF